MWVGQDIRNTCIHYRIQGKLATKNRKGRDRSSSGTSNAEFADLLSLCWGLLEDWGIILCQW